jgi:hypothetical protein
VRKLQKIVLSLLAAVACWRHRAACGCDAASAADLPATYSSTPIVLLIPADAGDQDISNAFQQLLVTVIEAYQLPARADIFEEMFQAVRCLTSLHD